MQITLQEKKLQMEVIHAFEAAKKTYKGLSTKEKWQKNIKETAKHFIL